MQAGDSLRIGCVRYLNALPLIHGWRGEVRFDHPSTLCRELAAGKLEVALVSSFEYLRNPDYSVEWYAAHQEEVLERAHERYWNDPEKYREQGLRAAHRRQERLEALPNLLTDPQREQILAYWGGCCAVCGAAPGEDGKALALDHWIPLADEHCPGTVAWNTLPLCDGRDGCNTRKHDCDPVVFVQRFFKGDDLAAQKKLLAIEVFLTWMEDLAA